MHALMHSNVGKRALKVCTVNSKIITLSSRCVIMQNKCITILCLWVKKVGKRYLMKKKMS